MSIALLFCTCFPPSVYYFSTFLFFLQRPLRLCPVAALFIFYQGAGLCYRHSIFSLFWDAGLCYLLPFIIPLGGRPLIPVLSCYSSKVSAFVTGTLIFTHYIFLPFISTYLFFFFCLSVNISYFIFNGIIIKCMYRYILFSFHTLGLYLYFFYSIASFNQ